MRQFTSLSKVFIQHLLFSSIAEHRFAAVSCYMQPPVTEALQPKAIRIFANERA